LIERKGGNLPRSWRRFANRGRGAEFLGNKHASHPGREPVSSNASAAHGPIVKRLSRKEPHRRRVSPR
jgi:hypothetical protein